MQSRRMDIIANNMANVNTSGFKQQLVVMQAKRSDAIDRGAASSGSGTVHDISEGVFVQDAVTDFGNGPIKRTGIPTDFAINGNGFFTVEADGQTLLTRAGNFHLQTDGQLVTLQGHAVLDESGKGIVLDPNADLQTLPGGYLKQGGNRIALGLARPQSLGDLARVGENLFAPLAETVPLTATERHVQHEHLEQSAVNPTAVMTEMIATSRAYEANVRMIQSHDSVIGSLVTRILRA